jgi:hypothetical protein
MNVRPLRLSHDAGAPSRLTRADWVVALLAIAAIAAHDAAHVIGGRYWDTLWICNVAALLVGPAILLRSPLLAAAALTWLVPGTVVWLADALMTGANILPTSYAVHLGGTAAAIYATRVSGFSDRGWLFALVLMVACVAASAVLLPASTNVNAAHAIPQGWTFLGGGRAAFAVTASTLVLAACMLGRFLGARIATRR